MYFPLIRDRYTNNQLKSQEKKHMNQYQNMNKLAKYTYIFYVILIKNILMYNIILYLKLFFKFY